MVLYQLYFTANLTFIIIVGEGLMILRAFEQTQGSCESFISVQWEQTGKHTQTPRLQFLHLPHACLCCYLNMDKRKTQQKDVNSVRTFQDVQTIAQCQLVAKYSQMKPVFRSPAPSPSHFYSFICLHFIRTIHISGVVFFAFVQQKLVWDSLGSHRVFSPFIKFKTRPIPGGDEEGRRRESHKKAASSYSASHRRKGGELIFFSVHQVLWY